MQTKTIEGKKQVFESKKEIEGKEEIKCFDCDLEIKISGEDIENGSLLSYEEDGKEFFVFKCDDCFSKNPELSDYKNCEVYSRIVGYLRPVNQWNDGKKQEYSERKEYQISEE